MLAPGRSLRFSEAGGFCAQNAAPLFERGGGLIEEPDRALKDNLAADLNQTIALLAGTGKPGPLRMADALALWRAGSDFVRLEAALGVATTWRSAERRRRRDELYIEIARTFFPHLTGWALARAVDLLVYRPGHGVRAGAIIPH